ncbi:MAG TPA: helix-turn-helix transcriptional regulator [Patescibacteria group bacterium]|nr:helix-turn-helix transcriptional regulator [Patescibacteria group bacterium]
MSDILKIIGGNIKKYREMKAITQEELSSACKLHRNYIGSVERGARNLSVKSLQKISIGLNVKIERLFE